ncbi:unnamed protein product [Prorocentrum cordatum]|uniref:Ion transport domain-containing protein n=1 Tax=Prorocentrum cordatum TaxID=2364126 RepID=A0ABN9R8U3_9DINO|nr:unnamed protein product [Polarella glacialis]
MVPVARAAASNEDAMRAGTAGEPGLRQASLVSTSTEELAEFRVEDVIAGPARPAPLLFRPEAPKVTSGSDDLEETSRVRVHRLRAAGAPAPRGASAVGGAVPGRGQRGPPQGELAHPRVHVEQAAEALSTGQGFAGPSSKKGTVDQHVRPDSREAWPGPWPPCAEGKLPQQFGVEDSDGEAPRGSMPPPRRTTFTCLDNRAANATSQSTLAVATSNAASPMRRRQTQDRHQDPPRRHDPRRKGGVRKTAVVAAGRLPKRRRHEGESAYVRTVSGLQREQLLQAGEGPAQFIARSSAFEYITLTVISLNALWISVDVDENTSVDPTEASLSFQIMDNFFCGYFFTEWFIRFAAFELKKNCLRDRWFVFDSFLVGLTVVDTWLMALVFMFFNVSSGPGDSISVLRVFRLLRLTRMARMVRLLRAAPELMILVRGMAAASRSVALTLVLLSGIIYIYAIIFRQVTDGTAIGDQYFRSIPASMSSLLLRATLPDMGEILEDTGNSHILLGMIMLSFILMATLTVLNMLVGVLVEVVSVVATVEREELTMASVKSNMERLFEMTGLDVDSNSCVSRLEFENLLEIPEAVKMIHEVGVDVVGLIDYADMIFEGYQKELSFAEFFDVLLSLRGNNAATVKDIVDLRKFVYSTMSGEFQQANKAGIFSSRSSGRAGPSQGMRSIDNPPSPAEAGELTAQTTSVSQESV